MALKEVEIIRRRVVAGLSGEIVRLRSYISMVGSNQEAVDSLHGETGEALLADLTEFVMLHIGHATDVTRLHDGGAKVTSQARKAARRSGL